ncbi:LOW QUALITY PROTEIN: nose resistant to fluoxetine protein 6-like [Pecten maximus]|uniref:LOW QUALITY PROTEIN: nose resistant to fluoxetine protein 6-like n=1 Tax=Pecten maximus TaxID=6579 RepID=UPI0014580457|nr:LOW QUALITY PROTEIN: nose resistant to fluoxetine protein 6-like [Pecten maximus]
MYIYKHIVVLIVFATFLVDRTLTDTSTSGVLPGIPQTNSGTENTTSGATYGPIPGIPNTNNGTENTTSSATNGPIPNTNVVSNFTTAAGNQLPKYWQDFQSFLQNPKYLNVIEKQIGDFIKSNNVSFPISIMTPENLQKVLQLLGPGSGSTNLQGLSQYAGLLGNISNEIRNVTEELEQNIGPQCYSHLQFLVSELMKREQWAIKMVDAAGKIPSGLLDGNVAWTGSFDECLAVNAGKFDGKYCTASLPLTDLLGTASPIPGGITVRMGICIPDSCTSIESQKVVNILLRMVPLGQSKLQASSVECSEDLEYDAVGIAGFTVFGVFIALMALSTLFDLLYNHYQKQSRETTPKENGVASENKYHVNGDLEEKPKKTKQQGILPRLASSFSVYTNIRKLMNTEQASGALSAVNGIRFLSISWVVLGHTFGFGQSAMQNKTFVPDFLGNWTSIALANGLLSVDSFFTLSGLLVSYLFMKEMKREKGRINWFMFYFHRIWRLTPAYMLVMFLDMSLFRYLGDGPFFSKDGPDGKFCRKNWWTNILYINNLVNSKEMCFGWSWYLANDMQFYVVSPLLLVPLYFSKKIGLAVNFLTLLGIAILTGVVSSYYDLLPTIISTDITAMGSTTHYFYDYYVVPWCRMGPYIVGIVTGYIIYRTDGKFKIPKAINLLIWVAMAITACVVVYGISGPVTGNQWDNGVAALYNAVHRSVWGMCLCWVIFACVTGNGGLVNDFLSWKLFVPLGRLSYCIYLTHVLVIYYYLQTLRQPFYATTLEFTFTFLGTLMLSILTAIAASLAFEIPMMSLEKIIFRRGKQ